MSLSTLFDDHLLAGERYLTMVHRPEVVTFPDGKGFTAIYHEYNGERLYIGGITDKMKRKLADEFDEAVNAIARSAAQEIEAYGIDRFRETHKDPGANA